MARAQRQADAPSAELRARVRRIGRILDRLHPEPPIPLEHGDPFQLLVAVMLSAQTTDKAVNEVTPALFELAPDARSMAAVTEAQILARIRRLGLAPTKAKHLRAAARLLLERHDGRVPAELDALEALPGVGHKTASVVLVQAFGVPAFPVDTHIHRLAARWGLSSGRNVAQTERDLRALFPPSQWGKRHLQMIHFGRRFCPALRHEPTQCPICSTLSSTHARSERGRASPRART